MGGGEVSKFRIYEVHTLPHYSRYFINYALEVDYVLKNKRKAALFYKKFDSFTRELTITRENVNKVVSRNIKSLLRDKEFVDALNTHCAI